MPKFQEYCHPLYQDPAWLKGQHLVKSDAKITMEQAHVSDVISQTLIISRKVHRSLNSPSISILTRTATMLIGTVVRVLLYRLRSMPLMATGRKILVVEENEGPLE